MKQHRNIHSKIYNFKFEFTIIALLVSGLSLLATEIPFHIIVQNFIHFVVQNIDKTEQFFITTLITPLHDMEFSDIIGLVLLLISFTLLIRQVRQRLITSSYESHTCPACRTRLHRVHRHRWQHLLSKILYLSSGYFRCDTCEYSNLYFYPKSSHLKQGLDS